MSASDLCKRSAAQIFYLRKHPAKKGITAKQIEGTKQQLKNSTSDMKEMRGQYKYKDFIINFCVDEVKLIPKYNEVVCFEHKNLKGDVAPWYFNNSVLQTAIYHALAKNVNSLETASFFVFKGNEKKFLSIRHMAVSSYLLFGKDKYAISVTKAPKLLQFLVDKANASMDYNTAIKFDEKWKHNEFELLKDAFKALKDK